MDADKHRQMSEHLAGMIDFDKTDAGVSVPRLYIVMRKYTNDTTFQDNLMRRIVADMVADGGQPIDGGDRWGNMVATTKWGTSPEEIAANMVADYRRMGCPDYTGENWGVLWLSWEALDPETAEMPEKPQDGSGAV
jgi:hypothetical protein